MSHLRVPGADARAVEEVCNAVTSHTREDTLSVVTLSTAGLL